MMLYGVVALLLVSGLYFARLFIQQRRRQYARLSHGTSGTDGSIPLSQSVSPPNVATTTSTSSSSGFRQALDDGLSSDNFDIRINIDSNDTRPGLDNAATIKQIMVDNKCSFDQARLIYSRQQMVRNGIDPATGLPLDPKSVVFAPRKPARQQEESFLDWLLG